MPNTTRQWFTKALRLCVCVCVWWGSIFVVTTERERGGGGGGIPAIRNFQADLFQGWGSVVREGQN